MPELTHLIEAAQKGDRQAAAELLPLVYDELRKLAAAKMAAEAPGQTLNATALVHEAYLRLVGDQHFDGRGHFFAAAAEAMRRILIDRARSKQSERRGGGQRRVPLLEIPTTDDAQDNLIDLDAALARLADDDAPAAAIAKLRLFAGLSVEEAGDALGVARATAFRHWTYARAWLRDALSERSA